MPERIIDSFSVRRLDILDEKGEADMALMPSLSEAYIRKMLPKLEDYYVPDAARIQKALNEVMKY